MSFVFPLTEELIPKATAVVHGIIAHIPVPFPLDCSQACKPGCGLSCPVKNGESVTYKAVIPVKKEYPSVSTMCNSELVP